MWFQQIQDKNKGNFMTCDVKAMYPSITRGLYKDALNWVAQSESEMTTECIGLILEAADSVLIWNGDI